MYTTLHPDQIHILTIRTKALLSISDYPDLATILDQVAGEHALRCVDDDGARRIYADAHGHVVNANYRDTARPIFDNQVAWLDANRPFEPRLSRLEAATDGVDLTEAEQAILARAMGFAR